MSFAAADYDYPDSYKTPFRFITARRETFKYGLEDSSRFQVYCSRCSFRPWLDAGRITSATVTARTARGKKRRLKMVKRGGRWITRGRLRRGERAAIEPGGLIDIGGNNNGERFVPRKIR